MAVRRRVCIAYHIFPHYRAACMLELCRNGRHDYTLMSDSRGVDKTIKVWKMPDDVKFIQSPAWHIGKGVCLMPKLIPLAFDRRFDTICLLAVAWYPSTWPCALLARLMGKRVVFWGHGWTRPEKGARKWLRLLYYKLCHTQMTYGHYAKSLCMQYGDAPEKVHVIYNSLDYQAQRAQRLTITADELASMKRKVMGAGPGDAGERPIAICTTRLVAFRKLDQLIEACALLAKQGRPVDVLLVGDGPERERLAALAAERGVKCVFYGACYDEAVLSRLIMMSNVMVSPGAIGLAVMHAHAYGTPVVTHDRVDDHGPEFEAIVPGRNGSLFVRDDINDLARAVGEWTDTPSPRDRVREGCYSIIERFWNAAFQRRAIERAIDGEPADDLWWMKPGAEENPATHI